MAHRFPSSLAGIVSLLAATCLPSCTSSESGSGQREVELYFDARVGGERVACAEPLPPVGSNARDVSLKDLRFFVHDVQLTDSKGKKVALEMPDDGVWQNSNVALLDFENSTGDCEYGTKETNAVVRGTVPAGDYTGVSFRVGVPAALSHADTAKLGVPLKQANSKLYWGWLQGFIFFRLDLMKAETANDREGAFEVHLGAQDCSNGGKYVCAQENVASIELPRFDLQTNKVVLDLGALLSDVKLVTRLDQAGEPLSEVPGCASGTDDPDCEPVFAAFGLDLASGKPAAKAVQTAFIVGERESDDPGRTLPPDAGATLVDQDAGAVEAPPFDLKLPAGFDMPAVPADNPLSAEKVELGRHLFYDKRLSGNQTQACASCHKQELAFTDGRAVGLGSTGESHVRGAMSLANVAYTSTLTWANRTVKLLEKQAHVPMFGENPVELGLAGRENELIERLRADPKYQELFPAAFHGEHDPFSVDNVERAIASFERTLISANSPYDRYSTPPGDPNAISESAKRGANLFFNPSIDGTAFECFHCHGGPTFSDQLTEAKQPSGVDPFHNTGLYNLDFLGSYPQGNQGIYEDSKNDHDRGRFKAPTLRNIAVTAPYMHDGSIATLEDVVAHYARGGRLIESGPNMGDGKLNRNKNEFIHGFASASAQDRADLIEFLKSLTDDEFLTNPAYRDPWK